MTVTEIVTDIRYDGTSARDCCHMADEFFTERLAAISPFAFANEIIA